MKRIGTLNEFENTRSRGIVNSMRSGSSDHFQTPEYALNPLLPYLSKNWQMWEPACGKRNIVRMLNRLGYCIEGSDIDDPLDGTSVDFLTYTLHKKPDAIVTNPPFSLANRFIERCYELDVPFALLLPLTKLEETKEHDPEDAAAFGFEIGRKWGRQTIMRRNGIGVLVPSRRIAFETPSGKPSKPQFTTAWFCHGLGIDGQIHFVDM